MGEKHINKFKVKPGCSTRFMPVSLRAIKEWYKPLRDAGLWQLILSQHQLPNSFGGPGCNGEFAQ